MPSIDLSAYRSKHRKNKVTGASSSVSDWKCFLTKEIHWKSNRVSKRKKESFYNELGTLLLSGIDLKTSFDLIVASQNKEKDRSLFLEIKKLVILGHSLSEAIKLSGKFTEYEWISIQIGEETGKLGEVLSDLSAYFNSRIIQRRKIISALTYPSVVMITSVGAVTFMLKFVVPMFGEVFRRFGGKLPWITSAVIRLSSFLDHFFFFFILFGILTAFGLYLNRKKIWFRKFISSSVLKIPVLGDIVRTIYLARFANTMRLLVSTDTPLLVSITLVRNMIGFYPLESTLESVSQSILKGLSLSQSLSLFDLYPPKFVQLIKVGEEVNRLEYFFDKIAIQYTMEVEHKTSTISNLLEPLIIIFLGMIVGLILISMYLPMFEMSNNF